MTTPTMIDLVTQLLDKQEANRKARFDASKSTTEKLLILGVLTTADDEQEKSYRHAYYERIAKEAGVSFDLVCRAEEFTRVADAIVAGAEHTAHEGETESEHWERLGAILINTPGPAPKGRKTPCYHNSTTKERGVMFIGRSFVPGSAPFDRYGCCRCGTQFQMPAYPTNGATDAAREAAEIVMAYKR